LTDAAINSSFSIHGIGVSSGIAIGHAHLVSNALLEVVHYQLPKPMIDDDCAL
jgi:phosphoenolpyruvate-protein phosphotransferase (PTS system enzyme I)